MIKFLQILKTSTPVTEYIPFVKSLVSTNVRIYKRILLYREKNSILKPELQALEDSLNLMSIDDPKRLGIENRVNIVKFSMQRNTDNANRIREYLDLNRDNIIKMREALKLIDRDRDFANEWNKDYNNIALWTSFEEIPKHFYSRQLKD